jgi:hypothetical protein
MKRVLIFKIGFLWSLVVLTNLNSNAQTITGCVIYEHGGTPRVTSYIYTSASSSYTSCNGYSVQVYSSSAGTGPLNTLCYTPDLPNASPALYRNCVVGSACGIIKTITIVPCPLDDYTLYLLFALAFTGLFAIRKTNLNIGF